MSNVHIDSTLQNKLKQKTSIHHSSSTVFLVINNPQKGISTEISLLNHFILKRGISDVVGKISVYDLYGKLIDDFSLNLNEKRTYTVDPCKSIPHEFVGSAYINFHSSENLAVPFCAVVETIKTKKSVCSVHTYGRKLEQKEYGTSIDINETIETGWTLRDSGNIKSFAVFHNGEFLSELTVILECSNFQGELIIENFKRTLSPFETLIIKPQKIFPNLKKFLNNKIGHAKVWIKGIKGVFPRMMCGNFADESDNFDLKTAQELQFTHTNFDFSSINQPDSIGKKGYFNHPSLPKGYGIFYPVKTSKNIKINNNQYVSGTLHKLNIDSSQQADIQSYDSNLPSRFIASSVGKWDNAIVDSECSTGVFIEDYLKAPSHWKWGLLKPGFESGESIINIMLNKFSRNEILSRKLNLYFYSDEGLNIKKVIEVNDNVIINAMDYLPRKLPKKAIWYVLTGDMLEDLFIFCTFFPDNKSGFTEHSF